MDKDELLPCPFCGGKVDLEPPTKSWHEQHGLRNWWGVACRNTINLGGSCAIQQIPSASKEAAIERWNRRALTTPQPGVREGVLRAAVIAENLVPGHSLEIGEAIRAEAEKLPQSHCVWRQEESNTWAGDCGALWTFTDGGPKDNQFAFCPQCGRAAQEERK
jgi:hypothetical protein